MPSSSMLISHTRSSSVTEFPPSPPPERYRLASLDKTSVNPLEKPVVAVIGTGYVGSNLVKVFAEAGIDVIAHDISEPSLKNLQAQSSTLKNIRYSSAPFVITPATHILIAVPTTLLPDMKTIDTSFIQAALCTVVNHARRGATVVIESSVAVGTTRKLLAPFMQLHGFLGGMSPERIDPGRSFPTYEDTPKIISGLDERSLQSIEKLYSKVFQNLVPLSSPEAAEMTK
ncbi:UDP-N-acetyl-D-glucosamine 6-dehydrogenase, partial [Neolecta irregularis DAH-3]